MKASLVLEGGTFRSLYTAGVLDRLLEREWMFPYIVGVSAGALSACSYVSRQPERTLRVFRNYRNDPRYMGVRHFFTERSYFGIDFAYREIPNVLDPFDWETFRAFPGTLEFGVTNATTGAVEFVDGLTMNESCDWLQATCAIPLVFPERTIHGGVYYDGGLADSVPIERAKEKGFAKHVIVLTRPKGYRKETDLSNKVASFVLRSKYPRIAERLDTRAVTYNATMDAIDRMERDGEAFVFRPSHALSSFESDTTQMLRNYKLGLRHADARLDEMEQWLQS